MTVAVVIDCCNQYQVMKEANLRHIDYEKYLVHVAEVYGDIDEAYAFVDSYGPHAAKFRTKLDCLGFITVAKEPEQINGHWVTNWSGAIGSLLHSLKHDTIVLSSNSNELRDVCRELRSLIVVFTNSPPKSYTGMKIKCKPMLTELLIQ